MFCEDFIQWVVEDAFPAGRPAFEEVGVQFVTDVTPFEHMKIRILNGGHAIIAYPSGLMDIHFVHEGMAEPAGPRLPHQGRDRGDPADPAAGPRHRPRRLLRADRPPLRQPQDRRHHPPPLPRRLQPPAEVHHPLDRRPPRPRPAGRRPRARIRALGPLLRRHHRQRASRSSPTTRTGTACTAQAERRPRRPRRPGSRMRDIYGATADAPGLPRRLRRLAPRALVRRHRRHPPPLPRRHVTPAPQARARISYRFANLESSRFSSTDEKQTRKPCAHLRAPHGGNGRPRPQGRAAPLPP